MNQKIRKAVFPVAGLGTRFLPATKASPKEMLPVVDKPLIQYCVEEAVAAGIDTMIFVTGRTKNVIMDHFDKAYELENELTIRGKTEILQMVRGMVPPNVSFVFIRQPEALGLGHAVLCAKSVVGDGPFAVILADDLITNRHGDGCMSQMVEQYDKNQCSILGVEKVNPQETDKYGIVKTKEVSPSVGQVELIIEKPSPERAPSNLAVVGRYILTPAIFEKIETTERGAGGEIQLTDAIAALMTDEQVLAYEFEGKRYDCGSKLGYLQATVEYGLEHDELKGDFRDYLKNLSLD
ncbi:UTP--glucose-1-phosphate uridylyltransferase GalU [Methylobacter sp.]|uniref:UTP--glucose-1-phosphate uridylyltransferase GalU n=1 Tax=Methylobacter sp. TaxID=2051955 RepID=UPI0024889681|nr:UTP--glucose-1-phosphate uridylyltransferase GalU [Methylobacter sp.]MDI1278100.1 UTP--glucose-1-phosphate uridylyltransferase GalU [Methylobacter sp.]MDI1358884.1 UTP--glucose-1-phosphate uridylyltransferase GalU [Methylobacter sp.]